MVDLGLGQAAEQSERSGLSGTEVLGTDVHDAVGIDTEGHLDLWDTTRRGRQAVKLSFPGLVGPTSPLTLEDVHEPCLVVQRCRKTLDFRQGMVVFRGMMGSTMPPLTSMPMVSGSRPKTP